MNRREFIKHSAAALAGTSLLLSACKNDQMVNDQINDKMVNAKMVNDKMVNGMTYRTNPNTGDKVSLLGFGMMRLPEIQGAPS